MSHIYSNAIVCIAAEAAPDSSLGVFESSKRNSNGVAEALNASRRSLIVARPA